MERSGCCIRWTADKFRKTVRRLSGLRIGTHTLFRRGSECIGYRPYCTSIIVQGSDIPVSHECKETTEILKILRHAGIVLQFTVALIIVFVDKPDGD